MRCASVSLFLSGLPPKFLGADAVFYQGMTKKNTVAHYDGVFLAIVLGIYYLGASPDRVGISVRAAIGCSKAYAVVFIKGSKTKNRVSDLLCGGGEDVLAGLEAGAVQPAPVRAYRCEHFQQRPNYN